MVQKSIDAIHELGLGDNSVEIIDLRTINPIDYETIKHSISKTGKVLVIYEDNLTNGPGSEICSVISDKYFELLDGPVRRIASKDSPVPYNWFLEENVLIQTEDIVGAINDLLEY
jgi:pyruvate/2-oxoglutarate/acetoin dehydrogenase E1 component